MNNFIRRIVKRLFCLLVRKEKFAVPSIVYNNKLLEGKQACFGKRRNQRYRT